MMCVMYVVQLVVEELYNTPSTCCVVVQLEQLHHTQIAQLPISDINQNTIIQLLYYYLLLS
jgi:phosphoserine aminotransferase